MDNFTRAPLALKTVATLFIIGGALSWLEIILSLKHMHISLNFGVLGVFIGSGLLDFKSSWRTWALAYTWLGLICIPILAALILFGPQLLWLKFFGQPIGNASQVTVLSIAALTFAFAIWQYRVLTRRDVSQLFEEEAAQ